MTASLSHLSTKDLKRHLADARRNTEYRQETSGQRPYDGYVTPRPANPMYPDLPELLDEVIRRLPDGLDDPPTAPARRSDPRTSAAAVRKLTQRNACGQLAKAFYKAKVAYGYDGLTTASAVRLAGLERLACPWKRISDLKHAGIVAAAGFTALGPHGADQEVLTITDHGIAEVRRIFPEIDQP